MTYLSVAERQMIGMDARDRAPWTSHAEWSPPSDRFDPVAAVTAEDVGRLGALVPIRHSRMLASPFTFYRGAAAIMAADLASTSTTGIHTQLCGDAHLSNFGLFASPERSLVFDLNDFDETLPGPWEWDVKRLAASFVIAGRNNGFDAATSIAMAHRSVSAYQNAMNQFADLPVLEVWYTRLRAKDLKSLAQGSAGKKRMKKTLAKAKRRGSMHALSKLAVVVDGEYRIISDPPFVVPIREATGVLDPDEVDDVIREVLDGYLESARPSVRVLLSRYRLVDVAHKIVGVGSVGTRCFIVLLEGRDQNDPLFLQAKEATPSVLEAFLPASSLQHPGRRVVEGQRLMQATSDIFLGWTSGRHGHDYYFRQLRDMKGSAEVEEFAPERMGVYADLCGWTLARAHARSGDPVAIATYLGTGDEFATAVAEFSRRYADQNERDYDQLQLAVADGRLESTSEGDMAPGVGSILDQ